MTDPQNQNPMPQNRRGLGIAATAALLLLLLIAGGSLVGMMELGAMMGFGDACSFTRDSLHCPNGEISYLAEWTIIALPPVGLLAGLALGAIGGGIAISRGRTGLLWASLAWATFVAAFVLNMIVASLVMW